MQFYLFELQLNIKYGYLSQLKSTSWFATCEQLVSSPYPIPVGLYKIALSMYRYRTIYDVSSISRDMERSEINEDKDLNEAKMLAWCYIIPVNGHIVASFVGDFDDQSVPIVDFQSWARVLSIHGDGVVSFAQPLHWSCLNLSRSKKKRKEKKSQGIRILSNEKEWRARKRPWERKRKERISKNVQQTCAREFWHLPRTMLKQREQKWLRRWRRIWHWWEWSWQAPCFS